MPKVDIWSRLTPQSQAAVDAGRDRAISIYALAGDRGDGFFIIVSTELNGPIGTRTEVITILES